MKILFLILLQMALVKGAIAAVPESNSVIGTCRSYIENTSFEILTIDPEMHFGVFAEGRFEGNDKVPRARVYLQYDQVNIQAGGDKFAFTSFGFTLPKSENSLVKFNFLSNIPGQNKGYEWSCDLNVKSPALLKLKENIL